MKLKGIRIIKIDFRGEIVFVVWLVVLRIDVDLAIFQPYLDLEAGDNQSLKIQVARPGIEPGPLAPQAKGLTTRPPLLLKSSLLKMFVTTGQTHGWTDRQTDRRRRKLSLCAAMLRRRHKNKCGNTQISVYFIIYSNIRLQKIIIIR